MKAKNVLIVFAILMISVMFTNCGTVGPTDPDNLPKDKSISVQYIRQPPVDYNVGDVVTLKWNYPNYTGATSMAKTAEDNFSCGAQIKTETKISMTAEDWRKYTECGYYAGHIFKIDGYQLPNPGSNCGAREFIYHNDGTIEVIR